MQDFPAIRLVVPTRASAAFDDPDWVFGLKHDVSVPWPTSQTGAAISYRGRTTDKRFTDLRTEMAHLPVQNAILDGEIVCLDSAGRSQFNELLDRRANPAFYAFDLLWLNGLDLRELPLVWRKERLRRLIEKARCSRLIYAHHIKTKGTALYKEICRRDLEGIVCKKKDARYSSTAKWLKVMNPDYTQHDGRQEKFTAFREHSLRASR